MSDSSSQDIRGLDSRLMAENTLIKQLVGASNEGKRNVILQDKIIKLETFISEISMDISTALNESA